MKSREGVRIRVNKKTETGWRTRLGELYDELKLGFGFDYDFVAYSRRKEGDTTTRGLILVFVQKIHLPKERLRELLNSSTEQAMFRRKLNSALEKLVHEIHPRGLGYDYGTNILRSALYWGAE